MTTRMGDVVLIDTGDGVFKGEPLIHRIHQMKLFNAITAIALISTPTVTAAEGVNPKFHKSCENAKDYLGCIKAHTGETQSNDNGLDLFGMPKLKGYTYNPSPEYNSVNYRKINATGGTVYKIKVRGIYGRYIGIPSITRRYQQAIAASPAKTQTFGTAKTNCSGLYGSVTCTTTPAPSITLPGNPGQAGGLIQESDVFITDCVDLTYAFYTNNVLSINWTKLKEHNVKDVKSGCANMHTFPPMKWSKLAGGSPDEKDKKAAEKFLTKKTPSTRSNKVITRLEDLPDGWIKVGTGDNKVTQFIKPLGCKKYMCSFDSMLSTRKYILKEEAKCDTWEKQVSFKDEIIIDWKIQVPGTVGHATIKSACGDLYTKASVEKFLKAAEKYYGK